MLPPFLRYDFNEPQAKTGEPVGVEFAILQRMEREIKNEL